MRPLVILTLIFLLISSNLYSTSLFGGNDKTQPGIPNNKEVTEILDVSEQLRDSSFAESIKIGKQALDLAVATNNPSILGVTYKSLGVTYFYQGLLDSSQYYYEKAIDQYEQIGDTLSIGKVIGNIGIIYRKTGKYDKALEHYLENLKIFLEIGYDKGLGSVFNNLGNLYQLTGDLDNAKKYYMSALSNFKNYNNTQQIANAFCNLGSIYEKRKDFVKSLEYYNKSLAENSRTGNKSLESKLYFNIGYLYRSQSNLDSAFYYVVKSEEIRILLGNREGLASSKLELGRITTSQENYNLAEKYLQEAHQIAIENNMLLMRSEILYYLTELYQKQEYYKKAFEHQTEMIQANDSIISTESNKRYEKLAALYEAEKREKELELLQQESQIQILELGKKNAWIITLLTAMILGVVAIIVSLRINRLRADHKIMNLRQKVLLTQMNPHFLFNSLTAIQSFILDKRNDEANNYLSRLASLVRGILENSREEFVSLRTELETLKDYIGLQKLRFENDIAYQFEIDENIDQDQVMVPPMLAQPFVENALIHGMLRNNPNAEIKVKISLLENETLLRFQIQDNGIGIDEAKNLNPDKNHKSIATSIALDRVKIYNFKSAKKMHFEIIDLKNIDPDQNGTRVSYTIPLITYANC